MSSTTKTTNSMIMLVVVVVAMIGAFSYFMARHAIKTYQGTAPRVAIPAPAHAPGL